jgi:hypothetical protein
VNFDEEVVILTLLIQPRYRVFPEHHLIAETEYRFLTEPNATAHQLLATCGIKSADSDTKVLRAKDGTLIGEFSTGGMVSIHDLPTSEWYNPMRLTFKNGSSIEALPQKDDTVRGENHFCNGFRSGKIPTPDELIKKEFNVSWIDKIALPTATETKEMVERVRREIFKFTNEFPEEDKKLKFTFYVTEGTRVDKSCNGTIPTMTTTVEANSYSRTAPVGTATCDKADYDMRQGVLEALANMYCDGDFDKVYNKAVKGNELVDRKKRTCKYCGKVFDTVEEREAHEAWHVERRKARHERYLLRKRAKEIAFEETAQKMAKEMIKK